MVIEQFLLVKLYNHLFEDMIEGTFTDNKFI